MAKRRNAPGPCGGRPGACRRLCLAAGVLLLAAPAHGQTVPSARVSVFRAEGLRAPTPRDLTTLRVASRSRDGLTAKLAVRALGRLERPSVISTIVPALKHPVPENRAEAANALAQAA